MKDKNIVMIDIETLGTRETSVILSIGAYTKVDGIEKSFYVSISQDSQFRFDRTVDRDTVSWWDKQDPDVKND